MTPEREREIRALPKTSPHVHAVGDLLAEIDRLRARDVRGVRCAMITTRNLLVLLIVAYCSGFVLGAAFDRALHKGLPRQSGLRIVVEERGQ